MHDLATFSLADMVRVTGALRGLGADAVSMEDTANRIVRHLYEQLIDAAEQKPACPLVRCFKTHPFDELEETDRQCALEVVGRKAVPSRTLCFALLASAGDCPEWNDRLHSKRYRTVPITDARFPEQFPMFAHLLSQLGMETSAPLETDPRFLLDHDERTFGVFHVPDAVGSPYVPVQHSFVIPYGIRSVVGIGGLLPSRSVFTLALFSRVPVARAQVEMFRTIALAVKLALLPFDGGIVFSSHRPVPCEERR